VPAGWCRGHRHCAPGRYEARSDRGPASHQARIHLVNRPTVDADFAARTWFPRQYRAETFTIEPGIRIAQWWTPRSAMSPGTVDTLPESGRGKGGFGSTRPPSKRLNAMFVCQKCCSHRGGLDIA